MSGVGDLMAYFLSMFPVHLVRLFGCKSAAKCGKRRKNATIQLVCHPGRIGGNKVGDVHCFGAEMR